MNKKNIYLIIFIIFLAILILLGFFIFNYKKGDEGYEEKQVEEKIISEDKFPLELAKENSDVNECLNIADSYDKSLCIVLLAEYLKNNDICLNLEDENKKTECLDRVGYENAFEKGDLMLCSYIKNNNLGYSCVSNIINKKKYMEMDYCNNLPEREKKYCSSQILLLQDGLIYKTAKTKEDCNKIKTEILLKADCLSRF